MPKKHRGSLESWIFWTYVFTRMRVKLNRVSEISLAAGLKNGQFELKRDSSRTNAECQSTNVE